MNVIVESLFDVIENLLENWRKQQLIDECITKEDVFQCAVEKTKRQRLYALVSTLFRLTPDEVECWVKEKQTEHST